MANVDQNKNVIYPSDPWQTPPPVKPVFDTGHYGDPLPGDTGTGPVASSGGGSSSSGSGGNSGGSTPSTPPTPPSTRGTPTAIKAGGGPSFTADPVPGIGSPTSAPGLAGALKLNELNTEAANKAGNNPLMTPYNPQARGNTPSSALPGNPNEPFANRMQPDAHISQSGFDLGYSPAEIAGGIDAAGLNDIVGKLSGGTLSGGASPGPIVAGSSTGVRQGGRF